MIRTALAAGLAAGLLGCASPLPQTGMPAPQTAGQALAQLACPHRIAQARAWVNHMPGIGRAPRDLTVDVRLAEATDTAVMLKSVASTGDHLVLEIRTAPAAPMPGRLSYREPASDRLYTRISFFCRGGQIHVLDAIEHVY